MRKFLSLLAVAAVLFASPASAQTKVPVKGRVLDELGQPVSFASVRVKGEKQGVSADADGNFTIRVVKGSVLQVNAVGFGPGEMSADERRAFQLESCKRLAENVVDGAIDSSCWALCRGVAQLHNERACFLAPFVMECQGSSYNNVK